MGLIDERFARIEGKTAIGTDWMKSSMMTCSHAERVEKKWEQLHLATIYLMQKGARLGGFRSIEKVSIRSALNAFRKSGLLSEKTDRENQESGVSEDE
jgi:hypothetical protein